MICVICVVCDRLQALAVSAGNGTSAWGGRIKSEPYLWQQIVAGPAEDHTVSFAAVDGVVLPPMYGTFRLNFHRFDRLELDLRGHTQP